MTLVGYTETAKVTYAKVVGVIASGSDLGHDANSIQVCPNLRNTQASLGGPVLVRPYVNGSNISICFEERLPQ
ncbi:hypothetical protein LB506_000859 [Fusarium annulatum]|nr:hypothetical protein LB506_000859 [Fusarium annulatum]